jgi:hypothetical protein
MKHENLKNIVAETVFQAGFLHSNPQNRVLADDADPM